MPTGGKDDTGLDTEAARTLRVLRRTQTSLKMLLDAVAAGFEILTGAMDRMARTQ